MDISVILCTYKRCDSLAAALGPPSLYADPSKAKEILGWKAKRNLDEILVSAWKWQQKLEGGRGSRQFSV
jgi:nucleoside-diphosphate-sugar epimerase